MTLNNKIRSYQIPIATQFYSLPSPNERIFTGTYLSTAIPFEDAYDASNEAIANFALLLLDDPEAIIRDIRIEPDGLGAVIIRSLSPTLSMHELAVQNGWDVSTIIELANNLIYWRRARSIYPINHRNTYIVSPLSPLGSIYHFSTLFQSTFSHMPSLARILSTLSTKKPRPYQRMIPTRDHREQYLKALAWLLRYGFVTQLRTFLWLKVTREIKLLVNKDIRKEEERRESDLDRQNKMATAAGGGAASSSDEDVAPLMQTTDYASNTAHHIKGESPNKTSSSEEKKNGNIAVVVHSPEKSDSSLKFPKTAVQASSSMGYTRSMLQNANAMSSSLNANNHLEHPVSSILMSNPSNGYSNSMSTPSHSLQQQQQQQQQGYLDSNLKTSEHSTSAAISMARPSNVPSNGLSAITASLATSPNAVASTAFVNSLAPSSLPTHNQIQHSNNSIVGSLGVKRGVGSFMSGGGISGGIISGGGMTTDRSIEDEQAIISNEEWIEDSILLDPSTATALQMKWVSKIMEGKSPEIKQLLGKVLKYMDGRHAMESVLVEENISRQDLRKLTKVIEDYIVIVRHW